MSLLTLPIGQSRKCSNLLVWLGRRCVTGTNVSLWIWFLECCVMTLASIPWGRVWALQSKYSLQCRSGCVFLLCMGPAGTSCFCEWKTNPCYPWSLLCVLLLLLCLLGPPVVPGYFPFSHAEGPFLQGDYMCRWIAMSVVCTGIPQPSLCLHSTAYFQEAFLATQWNCSPLPQPCFSSFPKAPVTISRLCVLTAFVCWLAPDPSPFLEFKIVENRIFNSAVLLLYLGAWTSVLFIVEN